MRHHAPSFKELMDGTPDTRRREKLRQILSRNNQCQIWIGGSENDRYEYPYRLAPVDKVTDRVRNAASQLMIDSAIGDSTISNRDVIETAIEYDAQYVIPKDYWGDIDRTQESIEQFLELYDTANCEATVIFPLQPPHDEHYTRYEEFFADKGFFAVGGMKEASPEEQLAAVRTARDTIGPHKWIHGLGMGCSNTVLTAIQREHRLLDSLDTSTFERLPSFGTVTDARMTQTAIEDVSLPGGASFSLPQGEDISTLNALLSEFMVYQANYRLTSLARGQSQGDATKGFTDTTPASDHTPRGDTDTNTHASQQTLSGEWSTSE